MIHGDRIMTEFELLCLCAHVCVCVCVCVAGNSQPVYEVTVIVHE